MSSSKPLDERQTRRLARQYLRFGTHSTSELRAYLRRHIVAERLIEPLIAEGTRSGWLDDRACTKLWALTLAERGYAWDAIREQLLTKGLDATLLERVLTSLRHVEDDAARARLVVASRLRGRAQPDRRLRTRLARLLAQRGFDPDLIEQVLHESCGSTPSDAER